MRFKPTSLQRAGKRAGFTLAEALAALVFMAIVIPVAMQGLHIANEAGVASQRKTVAARIAQSVLNEAVVTSQNLGTSQRGSVDDGVIIYNWTIKAEPWTEANMRLLTVEVTFPVQGSDKSVLLSTLIGNSTQ